jgi:anti-sigma factor RsiW
MMNEKILELLYRSFDGDLSAREEQALREGLESSEELRRERRRIEAMRGMVSAAGADTFGPYFAERVMTRVAGLREVRNGMATVMDWLPRVFRRVAFVGAMVAAGLVAVNLVQAGGVSLAAVFGISPIPIEEIIELPVEPMLEEVS